MSDQQKPDAALFDLDGTLALHTDREWFEYDKCETDRMCDMLGILFKSLANSMTYVIVLTGRPKQFEPHALRWMRQHGLEFDYLHMRPDGEINSNSEFKQRILTEEILPKFNVVAAFEDNPPVVQMLLDHGIPVFQPHRPGPVEQYRDPAELPYRPKE